MYPNLVKLEQVCRSFVGKEVNLHATIDGLPPTIICNPNIVGNLLEDVFFPHYKAACPDMMQGDKQMPPDFYGFQKEFLFEQKTFCGSPSFDLSNMTSLLHQLSHPGELMKKIFKTKYLVYEYQIKDSSIVITDFWLLNIWNLPSYNGKYPMSMQVKKNIWYNLRPGSKSSWTDNTKTCEVFFEKLIECIEKCPHIYEKEKLTTSIISHIEEAKTLKYF